MGGAVTPYYSDPLVSLYLGDCLEVLPTLEAEGVDAVVTDPPYGLGFMGKHWDHGVPNSDFWREMHRVAKPGAYLLAFGGTRTVHRIATNIEDAGWIIRDMLMWIYASGFPKGKANLKPAHEPIVLARKPGPLRPLGIEVCRIGTTRGVPASHSRTDSHVAGAPPSAGRSEAEFDPNVGRWPSNVLLSDPELFDEPNPWVVGSGAVVSSGDAHVLRRGGTTGAGMGYGSSAAGNVLDATYGDSGGYSRFFLVPKADRAERERGLAGAPKQHGGSMTGPETRPETRPDRPTNHPLRANVHPTVKPIDLMRHLVRLVTPPGGTCLDPFLGSGTTALAASEEGFRCIGIEREAEYLEIAKGRLMATPMGLGLDVPAPTSKYRPPSKMPPIRHDKSTEAVWDFYTPDEEPAA